MELTTDYGKLGCSSLAQRCGHAHSQLGLVTDFLLVEAQPPLLLCQNVPSGFRLGLTLLGQSPDDTHPFGLWGSAFSPRLLFIKRLLTENLACVGKCGRC